MQVVVRNTRYASDDARMFGHTTYEGELVATPKWVEYDAIALTTGDPKFKIRIIPKEKIVSIDGQQNKYVAAPVEKIFTVAGSKGNVYNVTIGTKHSSCTCPAFQFRRSCKHIAMAA